MALVVRASWYAAFVCSLSRLMRSSSVTSMHMPSKHSLPVESWNFILVVWSRRGLPFASATSSKNTWGASIESAVLSSATKCFAVSGSKMSKSVRPITSAGAGLFAYSAKPWLQYR